jgi:SpoVK/Ycf46/Vps4 family AAA+-type ATPase
MIDGINSPKNVLIIGITNRKDILDPALLRSGRLEYHLEIPLPNELSRKHILNLYLKPLIDQGLTNDIDIDKWAHKLDKYSGADIEALIKKAANIMVIRNILKSKTNMQTPQPGQPISSIISDNDLETAFNSFKPISMMNNPNKPSDIDIGSTLNHLMQFKSSH